MSVLVLLALVTLTGAAEAALPAPPFTLDAAPAHVAHGGTVTLQLTPRGGAGEFDVYLMWETSEEAAFRYGAGRQRGSATRFLVCAPTLPKWP